MLNRRLLRVKVMQALYAFYQCKESNFELGLEEIAENFLPDLNSMEVQDSVLLNQKTQLASEAYKKTFTTDAPYTTEDKDVVKAADDARRNYDARVAKDSKHFRTMLIDDAESINQKYLQLLQLLVKLSDYTIVDEEEKKGKLLKATPTASKELKFYSNKAVDVIRKNKNFELACIKKNINIPEKLVRTIFRDYLKEDEVYKQYQSLSETTLEQDRDICAHILKQVILKKEASVAYFESGDLNWTENSSILKNMIGKTLKMTAEIATQDELLVDTSSNWEEDREYYLDLYDKTLQNDVQIGKYIEDRLQNWESDRVAITDMIIMKLATAEMLYFPSIPIKVTINEFIDISKIYSTPKSKLFVNGILDKIASDLTNSGTIRKSGRGLIDNK